MTTAFVQFYEGQGQATSLLRSPGRQVRWRLLAANNRELGRGVQAFGSLSEAATSVQELIASLDDLRRRRDVSPVDQLWRWHLDSAAGPVATAHRGYSRRVECLIALDQFVAQTPTAVLRDHVRFIPGSGRRSSVLRDVTVRPADDHLEDATSRGR